MYNSAELTGPVSDGFEHYPSPYTLTSNDGAPSTAQLPSSHSSDSTYHSIESLPQNVVHLHHQQEPYHYPESSKEYRDSDHFTYHHRPVSVPWHVRHISAMLNEELAYLSLLTVPMLAWLPPSLFMESVAVLLLSMQALAGACFLYAIRRSESFYQQSSYRHSKLDSEHQSILEPT